MEVRSLLTTLSDSLQSVLPRQSYLRYGSGNTNLLITAPHGGNVKPIFFPSRKNGVLVTDTYTRRLTERLIEVLGDNNRPYYMIADIHRSKVDLNRNKETCCEHKRAVEIWNQWDYVMTRYVNHMKNKYGKGLYLDIHSHNDSDEFHLGYGLYSKDLMRLRNNQKVTGSTMDSLGSPRRLIFGKFSFQCTLENNLFDVFKPDGKTYFFSGGRNIKVFSGEGIGAIQIECPVSMLKTKSDRNEVAHILAIAIHEFRKYYMR